MIHRIISIVFIVFLLPYSLHCDSSIHRKDISNMINATTDQSIKSQDVKWYKNEFDISTKTQKITNYIFEEGCVSSAEAAIAIAAVILQDVYGADFDNGLPLAAVYDDELNAWKVKTQLPVGSFGGVKYIIIKRSTAEVIAIWASK